MRQTRGVAVRASAPEWVRGLARVERNWIVLDPSTAESYWPLSEADLVFDLADVRDPQRAVTFARKYGLLHHGPGSAEWREPFSEWDEHARAIRGILQMTSALRDALRGDADALDELRHTWRGVLEPLFQGPVETDEQLFAQVSTAIAWLVSEGLEGVEERIDAAVGLEDAPGSMQAGPPGVFLFSAHPPDLVGYAYHQLALLLVNRAPLKSCASCGRHFVVADPRQRYCKPTCAGRARYSRWSGKRRLARA